MEFLKQWTFCICITLIISVIFSILTPQGSMGKFYKLIISLFIFISFVYPLSQNSNIKFDIPFSIYDDELADTNEKISSNMINEYVQSTLKDNDIIGATVESSVTFDNNEIIVDEIVVYIPDKYSVDLVKNLLYEELSVNAEVIHNGI